MAKKKASSLPPSRRLIQNIKLNPSLKFKIEEAYKSIRTNIMFSIMKKGCKIIVITSPLPGEGKTTTVINLASSFASADQRVLLIDGDLRKPKIHQYFSVSNSPGLTNYLGASVSSSERVSLSSIIHKTDNRNLSVICSGSIPPNPSEILGSDQMSDFLTDMSADYDYIIIDTPPINIVSDALPVISNSDGVVLVLRSRSSTHPELQKAISALEFVDAKILGFIVNFTENKKNRGYYTGSRKKSSYGYGGGGYGGYEYGYGYGATNRINGDKTNGK